MTGKVSRGETPEQTALAARDSRRRTLRREIVITLAIKLAVLYGIWFAFFSEPQLPKMTDGMDPDRVAATLISPSLERPPPPTPDRSEFRNGH